MGRALKQGPEAVVRRRKDAHGWVRSHRSSAGEGGSHPPGQARPPGSPGETDGGRSSDRTESGVRPGKAKVCRRGGMADATDLGSVEETRGGSNPPVGTIWAPKWGHSAEPAPSSPLRAIGRRRPDLPQATRVARNARRVSASIPRTAPCGTITVAPALTRRRSPSTVIQPLPSRK